MRYEDASHGGQPADNSHTVARPDVDTLPAGSYGPAGGNTISGSGTTSGASGADSVGAPPAKIVEVHGAGGATTVASGNFEAAGQFGVLTMDAAGNFNYVRNPNTPDGVKDVFNYTLADASGANSSTTLTIDIGQVAAAAAGQSIVALPAGVELSDIHVNGRDLIVDMPDGTQMVIPGGAVFVPQLMIGDVQVPPTNLAALLIDSEPQPAAGPAQSSGADWSDPVPPLDPGVPLGDLIPPTELTFTPPEFKEPGFFEASKPTVVIETPDNPAGVVDASESVNEAGLPGRNDGEPAGSGEIADGNPFNNSDSSETNTGTIVFTAPGGLQSVTVDGVAITAVGQTIAGQFGTMTITSINLATGQIGYSYTLADNTSGDNTQDLFSVVVTDKGGSTATGSLTVHIVDDVPTARNDTDSTDLVTHTATGNVVTGADTTSGSAGADTVGADNAQVTAIAGAGGSTSTFDESGNLVVSGQFGTLTIHADGSYSYTENKGAPGGSVDTFTYTLTDGDGDSSTATLTISNPDHTPTIVIETPDNPDGVVAASESVFEKGLPARGGEPAGSGEIADGNPNNNSDTSETNTGTIVFNAQDGLASITVDGTAITQVGQTISGQFGTMTITSINLATGQIGYSYTLADNTSGDNTADHFTVVVTDSDGDQATATLTVHIVDDVPTAHNDTDLTDANSHVATGNVITGADTTSGAAGADVVGADNAQVTAIAGVGGTDSTTDGSGNLTVAGQFGTLTINQDGSYTYTENQNAPGNSVDTFTYTLTDGDGDTSTATLTITNPNHVPVTEANALVQLDDDALAGGNPGGIGDGPDAVNLTGTLGGSGGDGQLTWDLQTTGAPSGFSYVDGPNGSVLVQQVQDGQTVTVLTITVNATTGAYTVTQNAPIDHAPGGNENNADFTINYSVTDVDGDSANGTLNIQVNDDTPVVTLADTTIPSLTVDETNLGINATASFAGNFTVSFGADGPATANSLTYTLGISASGADSGLIDTASGNHVFLFLENGQVVGREGADATAAANGPEVFTVTVDANGNVTLDQIRAVVQPNGTNPDTSEGVNLASGNLVTLTATATDHDGDTASQSLNLGDQLIFQDDGPTISATGTPPALTVDETNLSINATASIAGVFTSSFGADGAGAITYTLGISSSGADSGLVDTASGNHVFLFLENGVVVGREGTTAVAAASGPEVFTVSIDSSGNVTLDQIRAVVQPNGTNPDTSEGVTLSSAGLVTVTGTITDKDGDSSSATANLGQNLHFNDDGPTISASSTQPTLTVDETNLAVNATASFAGVFTSSFGADGAGTVTYTLGISANGADSGLVDTATGQHIFLVMNNGVVEGHVGSTSGALAFTVSVDASGDVTLDQIRAVVHPTGTNPDTSEGVTLGSDGLVTLTGTITDKDGDSATASANIGQNLVFQDDGPTITASMVQPALTVDETNLAVNATASFASVFTPLFGADGPATANSLTYALGVSSSGADSGLVDTATGNHVFLFLENGVVVGREGTSASAAASGPEVFTLSVDSSGNVTLDQIRAVVQGTASNPDTSEGVSLGSDNLVTLTATATDKDGDQASATANIGQNLTFDDDGPTAQPDVNSVAAGTTLTVTALSTSDVLHNDSPGADGFHSGGGVVGVATGTNTSASLSTGVGTVIHGSFGDLTLNADGSYTYVAKPNVTGVDHFVYTIEDGDGDTSTTTLNITVNQVTAAVGAASTVVSEEVLLAGTEHGVGGDNDSDPTHDVLVNSGNITLSDTISGATFTTALTAPSGTFTSGGTAITWVLSNGGQTLTGSAGSTTVLVVTIDNSGHYTVTLSAPIDTPNGVNAGENGGDSILMFGVTAHDNFGNTLTSGSLTVNVEDDAPTISASSTQPTLTVDETNLAVNATASFAGVFTSSFGADGAGTLTYTLGISANGADSGLVDTATGQHIFLVLNNGVVEGHVGSTSGALAFTVSVAANGDVTLDQIRAVVHPNTANPNDSVSLGSDGLVTLTGTITDKDGDSSTATANIGQNLVFQDDGPTISLSGTAEPTLSVDETNLAINATASIANLFTTAFGADGAGSVTYALNISGSGADSGLVDTATGNHVFLFLESGVVVGREGTDATAAATGLEVFTVSINSSGSVTLDQIRAVVHPDATNPDTDETVTLSADNLVSVTATVTDKDGDSASQSVNLGQNLIFHDDGPSAINPASIETGDVAQATIMASLDVSDNNVANNFGADGPGSITFANITNGEDSGFTSGGTHITLWLSDNGQTLEGRINSTDGTDGTLIYTVHIDQANSQYDFTLDAPIDNGSGVSFNNLTSTNAGNVDFRGVGTDSTAQPIDLLLSATSGGSAATVNTDSTSIGVANQSLNSTTLDSVRIDFVSNLTTGTVSGSDPTGFNFTGHDSSNGFIGLIPQVQGSQAQTVDFTVWALNTTLTSGGSPDSSPVSGGSDPNAVVSDGTSLTVTSVFAEDFNTGTTATVDISGVAVGATVAVGSFGVTVTKNADGSVTFHGIQEGDHYGVTTATDFNALIVQDVKGSFDLGTFSLSQTHTGSPLNLSYDLQITDGDGDSASVPGGIAIQLDPNSNTTPIITNNAVINNSSIHTQDVAHTALSTSSLIVSNDNIEQQGQRVFSVGQNAALMGALAAAGLDAEHLTLDGHHVALNFGELPVMTPLQTASLGSATALSAGTEQPVHSVAPTIVAQSAPAVQHSAPMHDMVASAHPLGAAASAQPVTMSPLLHGSTTADGHAIAPTMSSITAPAVLMPSVQQLAAAAHGSPQPVNSVAGNAPQHDEVVGKVLADALHGGQGQGQNIDTLLHSLPVHAAGANGALQALASHAGTFVSFEHMAMMGPYGTPHSALTVDMVMHQDAPPPAHG